jgi:peptidoglycan/LPS O-acetylase OafA/YrhL
VYLFHPIVADRAQKIAAGIGVDLSSASFERFMVTSLVTVMIAALSWRVFEGPLNDLKRHVAYDAGVRQEGRQATTIA